MIESDAGGKVTFNLDGTTVTIAIDCLEVGYAQTLFQGIIAKMEDTGLIELDFGNTTRADRVQ